MVAIVAIHELPAGGGRIEDVEDGAAPHLPDPALIPIVQPPCIAAHKLSISIIYTHTNICSCINVGT